MAVVNKFNVNKQEVRLDADIIENMSANDVSYNSSTQYDENTVGNKLSELDRQVRQVIYDVTSNNDGATFASLSELLSDENLSTLIPVSVRCGGMSIRFVQNSDNNYVKFFCTADEFTTDVTKWQGVDDVPTAGSNNLVKSGGVKSELDVINEFLQGTQPVDYSDFEISHGYLDVNGHYTTGTAAIYVKMDCTGFIAVKEGQKFKYSGITSSGNKSVCGYSDQSESDMVVLVAGQTTATEHDFTIPSGVNFIRAWSYNSEYSSSAELSLIKQGEQSDFVKKSELSDSVKAVLPELHVSYKILDASGNGDFTTIAGAIEGTPLNGTIIVYPGVYDMRGVKFNKGQSFIGVDKEHCIFRNPQVYHDSPFLFSGYYKNISWICDAILPADSYNQQNYTVHIDTVPHIPDVAYRIHFEDCYFFNGNGDCFGCGASKGLEIIVDKCTIELNGWMKNAACFSLHNVSNVTAGGEYDGAATVKIYNCILKSNRGALRFGSSNMQTEGVEWRSIFELVGNTFFSVLTNPNTGNIYGKNCITNGSVVNTESTIIYNSSAVPDTFRLSPMSTGNNVSWLNE